MRDALKLVDLAERGEPPLLDDAPPWPVHSKDPPDIRELLVDLLRELRAIRQALEA